MDETDGESTVDIDRAENRLYLTLSGMLDAETGRDAVDDLAAAAGELDPGFTMVNDISTFGLVSQEATDQIERGRRIIDDEGVSAVVRVLGDSIIGKLQFDRVAGDREYQVADAESVEQAEAFLDEFGSDDG